MALTQQERDAKKVADGRNRLRMLSRRAAQHGMTVEEYVQYRQDVFNEGTRQAVRDGVNRIPIQLALSNA